MNPVADPICFLFVRDYKENRRKCSLSPLERRAPTDGASRFRFVDLVHPERGPEPVDVPGGIVLDPDGPTLGRADAELVTESSGGVVALIDSTWARVPKVLARVRVAPPARWLPRSLPGELITAYPRVSKLYEDPSGGLASIEAVFAALVVLGQPDLDILHEYRWRTEFLRRNHLTWMQHGWDPRSLL